MFRKLPLAALALTLPLTASAQDGAGWSDLLAPDALAERLLQMGVMTLRTQVDLKYDDIAVDLRRGKVTISDVTVWPQPGWDASGDCRIDIDRLVLRGSDLASPETLRFKLQGANVTAGPACLPPSVARRAATVGFRGFDLPRVTVDMEYHVPGATADLHLFAQQTDQLALSLEADFSYLWMNGRADMEDPKPVAYLDHAVLTVENLGAWEAARTMLPSAFTDPERAPTALGGLLTAIIGGANREASGSDAGDPSALTEAQQAFVDSAREVWPQFLRDPDKLVIETGYPAGDDVRLHFDAYAEDPRTLFADLRPRMSLTNATARAAIPTESLRQALGDKAGELAPETRRRIGIALVTGEGAPRNIAAGKTLLGKLAEGGDGVAALELAKALAAEAPSDAYLWALGAGAASEPGAPALLDRLEARLPFEEVIALQERGFVTERDRSETLERIASIRGEALARMDGRGRTRSYATAAFWALLAKAAGDGEAADILAVLDRMAASAAEDGQTAWADVERDAEQEATQFWLEYNLPARFGAAE